MLPTSVAKACMRGTAILALLLLLSASLGAAATITVTNSADSGPGSLRAAIASAASGDTINFSLIYPTTITLATPLTFGPSVAITGPGSANLAISGADSVNVLIVNAGAAVQVSDVTITQGSSGLGGCIFNAGTLTLTNTTVTSCMNFAELGGGILNAGAAAILNLNGSTVTGNVAGACLQATILGAGGGIFNYLGTVNLRESTVSYNLTGGGAGASGSCSVGGSVGWGGGGGGILNFAGTIVVNSSTISNNSSSYGGGIFNTEGGTLTLVNSTIAGNVAGAEGGGIDTSGDSTATISFSTIFDNSAYSFPGLSAVALNPPSTGGTGGSCCIFIVSTASGGGGLVYGGETLTVRNSILAANTKNCQTGYGDQFISLGYNLSDDASCAGSFAQTTDLNNTPAGLDSSGLQNNGGQTQTIGLLSTSPAINAIPSNACTDASGNPVDTDQRGVPRPQGSGCDIGAFEYFHSLHQVPAVQVFLLIDGVQSSTLQPVARDVL